MGSIDYRLASADDDPDLRQLLRNNPMPGEVSVSLEREPNAFMAASIEGERHTMIVARDRSHGRPVGMASRSVYGGFLNGAPCHLGYLSQLRIDRTYRGRVGLLPSGFDVLRTLRTRDDLPFDLTTIIADNQPARRVLNAGLDGLPPYRALEPFTTLTLPLWRPRTPRPSAQFAIERGSLERIDDIAACIERNRSRFQFAPRWTASELLCPTRSRGLAPSDFLIAVRRGTVIGCLAVWNQNHFKQIVVHGYGAAMTLWRPVAALAANLLGSPRLPNLGQPIPHVYLSHVAIDDDRVEVFSALLARAYHEACDMGHTCLLVGFAQRHPFVKVVQSSYRAWTYVSIIYTVCWEGVKAAIDRIDGRIPHLEVALL
jgi:hypothetical protein